jgi:ABC-type phosphate/phosphonate transport system substrate-binding protein
MFANARMYALNTALAAAWRGLLRSVLARAQVDAEVIDHPPPQPLAALWARADMGCAFMCGYPMLHATPAPVLLAAPIPSPARYAGRAVYWTDLVVRAADGPETLEQAWGTRMAYTTTESQSGYHAPRRFLAPHATTRGGRLFSSLVGPLLTPRAVVEALLEGRADIGPLDSYAHDLLRAHEPALAARLRTVASTAPTSIPPLVGAAGLDRAVAERLGKALLEVAATPALHALRETLQLAGFAPITFENYRAIMTAADEADALGYRQLA